MKQKSKRQTQPSPRKGMEFTGWATFNWGIYHNHVYRTRKQAQNACVDNSNGKTWDEIKDHFKVVKVKCTIL